MLNMKVNQLKAGVILSYLSVVIGAVVSIIYTPIMLRFLGQSEYGLYTLAGSVVSYLSILNFGLSSSYIRFYSRYKVNNDNDGIARLNGMFITVFFVLAFIAFIAGMVLSLNVDKMFSAKLSASEIAITQKLMILLVVNLALSFPASVFTSYITANEQYFFQRVLNLVKSVASPFLSLAILVVGFRSIGMVAVTVAVNVTIDLLYIWFCIKKLKMRFIFKNFEIKRFKEIAVFSSFIFINIIVDQINWNIDKFILGIYQGSVATAIYGLAAQLNTYYNQMSTTISSVFIPRIHKLVNENKTKDINELFTRVGRIQFFVLTFIISEFIFFGHPFVLKWGGENYGDSYYIALVLMLPATIPLIQNLGIEIQRAKNLHRYRSYIYLSVAILNILLSIPLCKLFSGLGCAIGTAVSIIIGNIIVMNIFYHKKCDINMVCFWKNILKIVPSVLPPVLIGIALIKILNIYNIWQLLAGIIIYLIAFVISIWIFGLNSYEKSLFKAPIIKIMKKCGVKAK